MSTVLNLSPITQLTREQFYQLCDANRDLVLERSPEGELIIMSPVGGESGNQEAQLIIDSLREGKAERLRPLQEKMQEYLASGLRLGWLINPKDRQVEVYRAGQGVEVVTMPTVLSGEEVLPGFELVIP
jgi:Uma2 family endonuclease